MSILRKNTVQERLDEIVQVRLVHVWLASEVFFLSLAPCFRHGNVESNLAGALQLDLVRLDLIAESEVPHNARPLLPFVAAGHTRSRDWNDAVCFHFIPYGTHPNVWALDVGVN